jgi:hypothetical protein
LGRAGRGSPTTSEARASQIPKPSITEQKRRTASVESCRAASEKHNVGSIAPTDVLDNIRSENPIRRKRTQAERDEFLPEMVRAARASTGEGGEDGDECERVRERMARELALPSSRERLLADGRVLLFVSVVLRLYEYHGSEPLWVNREKVAELLGTNRTYIGRWLDLMVRAGFLTRLVKGHVGRCSEYTWDGWPGVEAKETTGLPREVVAGPKPDEVAGAVLQRIDAGEGKWSEKCAIRAMLYEWVAETQPHNSRERRAYMREAERERLIMHRNGYVPKNERVMNHAPLAPRNPPSPTQTQPFAAVGADALAAFTAMHDAAGYDPPPD